MRSTFMLLFTLAAQLVSAQQYSFMREFRPGTILSDTAAAQPGEIKWFVSQAQQIRFRENEKSGVQKFSAAEIDGFTVDSLKFKALRNFDVFAEEYAMLGKTSRIKQTFGEVIDTGSFNIYLVFTTGYNGFGSGNYANFVFERTENGVSSFAAYPLGQRMRDKRYDQAKENLYTFFKDYPTAIEKIKAYTQQQDFMAIIDLLKTLN
jgi:hypothetical protein